jgi:hypothetical protein
MHICVSVQTNQFFGNTNTQTTVAKEKNLRTEEKLSFVYLCIGVSGQRNHSLSERWKRSSNKPRCISTTKSGRTYYYRYSRHCHKIESKRWAGTNAYVSHRPCWIRQKLCINGCTAILLQILSISGCYVESKNILYSLRTQDLQQHCLVVLQYPRPPSSINTVHSVRMTKMNGNMYKFS